MKKIIKDADLAKALMPNTVKEVAGEKSLFAKLDPFIDLAESWVIGTFMGDAYFYECEQNDDFDLWDRLVMFKTLHIALPSLDLILTPNGFGIVSNSNVAPASKERVEALRASLLQNTDQYVDLCLRKANQSETWRKSPLGESFHRTLFMFPSDVKQFCSYEDYCKFRADAYIHEAFLEEEVVSRPLMHRLRSDHHLDNDGPTLWLIEELMEIVSQLVNNGRCHLLENRIASIVNFIKYRPSFFPEWEKSETALRYNPPIFENKKRAAGYFF